MYVPTIDSMQLYDLLINMCIYIYVQETPIVEYAQVDKSKKKMSQDNQEPTAENGEAMVEDKVTKVSVSKIAH